MAGPKGHKKKNAGAKAGNTPGTHSFGKWNAPRHRPIKQAGPTMIIYAGVKICVHACDILPAQNKQHTTNISLFKNHSNAYFRLKQYVKVGLDRMDRSPGGVTLRNSSTEYPHDLHSPLINSK